METTILGDLCRKAQTRCKKNLPGSKEKCTGNHAVLDHGRGVRGEGEVGVEEKVERAEGGRGKRWQGTGWGCLCLQQLSKYYISIELPCAGNFDFIYYFTDIFSNVYSSFENTIYIYFPLCKYIYNFAKLL